MNGRWWIVKRRTRTLEKRKVTVKIRVEGTLEELTEKFDDTLSEKLGKHVFNIRHQYLQIMKPKQMFIHIDFRENYTYKYNTEIQSVHFGPPTCKQPFIQVCCVRQPKFATLSVSMRHDPSAIWAHLKPMVEDARKTNPQIDSACFLLD